MFVDQVTISVSGGRGGDGAVSFRREKYIPKGGPDGGNGGEGGSIVFVAHSNVHTLANYRHIKEYQAENGKNGSSNHRTGRSGDDLELIVPVGTQITDAETGHIYIDFEYAGQRATLAAGGRGGKGNAGFVNSIRQAPKFAEKGDIGESFDLTLEMKLVADVALVGLPSAGKSTFISVVSNARPKIAEYHFTTLVPNLGVTTVDGRELVVVDVPGLIEGAHEGKGLGHTFLKHIERARHVLHCVDVNDDTPLESYRIIRHELEAFSPELAQKPTTVILTKADITDSELEAYIVSEFERVHKVTPYVVSAATHEGMENLMRVVSAAIPEGEEVLAPRDTPVEVTLPDGSVSTTTGDADREDEVVVFRPAEDAPDPRHVRITQRENWWDLENPRLEQMVRQTDLSNDEAKERVYDVLKKWNVLDRLRKHKATPGDALRIGAGMWEFRG